MSTLGLGMVPAPLAQLPWKILLLVLAVGCFGLVVLYSAAGGSLYPWAFSQGVRFFVFFGMPARLPPIRKPLPRSLPMPGCYPRGGSPMRAPATASSPRRTLRQRRSPPIRWR